MRGGHPAVGLQNPTGNRMELWNEQENVREGQAAGQQCRSPRLNISLYINIIIYIYSTNMVSK